MFLGIMYSDTKKTVVMRGERAEIRRHEDNLKVEGNKIDLVPLESIVWVVNWAVINCLVCCDC